MEGKDGNARQGWRAKLAGGGALSV
jgi:hypothetical protein